MHIASPPPHFPHPRLRLVHPNSPNAPRIVVAIPVRNEVERIGQCLRALAEQRQILADRVVLLLNGCIDGTEALVRAIAPGLAMDIEIVERDLRGADATAGMARSLAVQHAAAGLNGHDIVMTTDADGTVAPDWIEANLAALQRGAEVVCGRAVIDPAEALLIPAHLHEDDALECRLAALIDEMAHWLDPDPCDPWPRHTEHSGASLAFSVSAWRRAGGVPPISCGEDRAFVAALQRVDARIRHDQAVHVTVSGRMTGRAAGGMADTIKRRILAQDQFIDAAIETAPDRFRRISLRSEARAVWAGGRAGKRHLSETLEVSVDVVNRALAAPYFGAAWTALERDCKSLFARRVRFHDLPREIATAEELCAFARDAAGAGDRIRNLASA